MQTLVYRAIYERPIGAFVVLQQKHVGARSAFFHIDGAMMTAHGKVLGIYGNIYLFRRFSADFFGPRLKVEDRRRFFFIVHNNPPRLFLFFGGGGGGGGGSGLAFPRL